MYFRRNLFLVGVIGASFLLAGCAHDKNKAEKVDTSIQYPEQVTGHETLGVKNGDLVVQKKVMMREQLRDLQDKVYSLQDRVYGNEDYRSQGIYGALKRCRAKLVSPAMGGDGHLMWTEPLDRVVHPSDNYTIGLDNRNQVVGISVEYLKDHIARFKQYYSILQHRENELETKLDVCDTSLEAAKYKMKHQAAN